MTDDRMALIELLQKHDEGDFLRTVTEAVLQTLMEHDVEGMIGDGRYERGDGRQTWRNSYCNRKLKMPTRKAPSRSGVTSPTSSVPSGRSSRP